MKTEFFWQKSTDLQLHLHLSHNQKLHHLPTSQNKDFGPPDIMNHHTFIPQVNATHMDNGFMWNKNSQTCQNNLSGHQDNETLKIIWMESHSTKTNFLSQNPPEMGDLDQRVNSIQSHSIHPHHPRPKHTLTIDSGSSASYILPLTPHIHKHNNSSPISVAQPNWELIHSTQYFQLPLTQLIIASNKSYILPFMKSDPILSVATLCDSGYSVLFQQHNVSINDNHNTNQLIGTRNYPNSL